MEDSLRKTGKLNLAYEGGKRDEGGQRGYIWTSERGYSAALYSRSFFYDSASAIHIFLNVIYYGSVNF